MHMKPSDFNCAANDRENMLIAALLSR